MKASLFNLKILKLLVLRHSYNGMRDQIRNFCSIIVVQGLAGGRIKVVDLNLLCLATLFVLGELMSCKYQRTISFIAVFAP